MEQIMEVSGVGEVSRVPNYIEIHFELTTENADYAAVVKYCAESQEKLKEALMRGGLKGEDLKTVDFTVDTVYESGNGAHGETWRVFRGYGCRLTLKTQFLYQDQQLVRILSEIASSGALCKYRLRFFVGDAAEASEKAAKLAVADALRKAAVLAEAAGVRVLGIREIRYAGGAGVPYSDTEFRPAARAIGLSAPALTPNEVKLTEHVTMSFFIAQ